MVRSTFDWSLWIIMVFDGGGGSGVVALRLCSTLGDWVMEWYKIADIRKTAPSRVTVWAESASEQYLSSDRHLSAKLMPTFVDIECHVVSVSDLYGLILGFLDRSPTISSK
jgi:hypothetical protein